MLIILKCRLWSGDMDLRRVEIWVISAGANGSRGCFVDDMLGVDLEKRS